MVAIEVNERDRINASEILFMVYALGFTLEKVAAMQEHGIKGSSVFTFAIELRIIKLGFTSLFQGNMGKSIIISEWIFFHVSPRTDSIWLSVSSDFYSSIH